jgi:hypothetical protein
MKGKWEDLGKALAKETLGPEELGRGVRIALVPCYELCSPQLIR